MHSFPVWPKLPSLWICGVIDLMSYKASSRRTGGRAVVQTPANRLMAQQAPCVYVAPDIIHHYPCVRHPLDRSRRSKLCLQWVCWETAKGRGRSEHWSPAGARAWCRLWHHEVTVWVRGWNWLSGCHPQFQEGHLIMCSLQATVRLLMMPLNYFLKGAQLLIMRADMDGGFPTFLQTAWVCSMARGEIDKRR